MTNFLCSFHSSATQRISSILIWAINYLHTHMPTHTHAINFLHTHMPTHTHAINYLHTHMPTHTCLHTHAYTHTCLHTRNFTHMPTHRHAYTHTFLHTGMLTHTHAYTHTHSYTQTWLMTERISVGQFVSNTAFFGSSHEHTIASSPCYFFFDRSQRHFTVSTHGCQPSGGSTIGQPKQSTSPCRVSVSITVFWLNACQ